MKKNNIMTTTIEFWYKNDFLFTFPDINQFVDFKKGDKFFFDIPEMYPSTKDEMTKEWGYNFINYVEECEEKIRDKVERGLFKVKRKTTVIQRDVNNKDRIKIEYHITPVLTHQLKLKIKIKFRKLMDKLSFGISCFNPIHF